ncbi:MAG: hypothetical protein RSA10_01590 [Bacilli bacterium]
MVLIIAGVLVGGGFLMLLVNEIYKQFIYSVIHRYLTTTGKVVKNINRSSVEYINEEKNKLKNGFPKVYNFYEKVERSGVFKEEPDYDGATYQTMIEYNVSGKTYLIPRKFSSDRKVKKGKIFKIKYNSENPKQAVIIDLGYIMFLIIVLTIILVIELLVYNN